MTILKNTDREAVIKSVLTDTFKPRFDAVTGMVQKILVAQLKKDHPRFVELMNDPVSVPYIARCGVDNLYMRANESNSKLASPVYGVSASLPEQRYHLDSSIFRPLSLSDTFAPQREFITDDKKVIDAYKSAWADYSAAREKLSSLLYGYGTREKFTADFPEFESHLPKITVKINPPAVIVKDVRKELSKLGIPQK